MLNNRQAFIAIFLICIAALGAALYLQLARDMWPCPLCIEQRYAFAAVALAALFGVFLPPAAQRFAAAIGAVAALSGVSVAIQHVWLLAHPATNCGTDPLKETLNHLPMADWLPAMFRAVGFCDADYPPLFGLSIPAWSLFWLSLLAGILVTLALRRPPTRRVFAR